MVRRRIPNPHIRVQFLNDLPRFYGVVAAHLIVNHVVRDRYPLEPPCGMWCNRSTLVCGTSSAGAIPVFPTIVLSSSGLGFLVLNQATPVQIWLGRPYRACDKRFSQVSHKHLLMGSTPIRATKSFCIVLEGYGGL